MSENQIVDSSFTAIICPNKPPFVYSAFIQLSDPVTLTDTSE